MKDEKLAGARATIALSIFALLLCASSCADIWGFDDLSGDAGTLPVGAAGADGAGTGGSSGGVAGAGAGGSVGTDGTGGAGGRAGSGGGDVGGSPGSGGASGEGGAPGAGGSFGSGGGPGVGGSAGSVGGAAGGGVGGRAGTGGSGGVAGGGAGGSVGAGGSATGGSGVGGIGTGGRVGTGGAGGTGVCAAGTNRCVGGDLQTCSATGIWQSTGTSTHQLLVNPGFEADVTGWTTSVAGGFALVYAATGNGGNNTPAIAAQSPPNLAWFGGYLRADDIAAQSVVIPADATSISLSFYYAIFTAENGAAQNDVMDVTVAAGAQTIAVAHFSNANPVAAWTRFTFALPTTLAGQTVRLQFRDIGNANAITSFYIDTVALNAVACP